MRRIVLLLIFVLSISSSTYSQGRYSDVPRFEVGAQFDFNYLDGVNVWGGGLGGRFHYNFTEHVALDTELIYRQHNVLPLLPTFQVPPAIGQTTGLFGVRAGQRIDQYGFFGHARAGFMHFGAAQGGSLITRDTVPAFDVGATIEAYHGPVVLRFDVGEMIVAYGSATVTVTQFGLPSSSLPPPGRLGTRASPVVGLGFAVRF
jgi:hypothetical protein